MKELGLVLSSIVFALVLAEAVLRVTGIGMARPEVDFGVNARPAFERGRFVVDRQLFWEARPREDSPRRSRRRRPSGPPDRAAGRGGRDFFLGDSCTRLGLDGLPYPALLEGDARGRCGSAHGRRARLLVAPGTRVAASPAAAAHPDVLVVYFGWNDHWRTLGRTDREYAASLSVWWPTANLLRRRPEKPPLRVPPAAYRENLSAIATEAATAGIRVLFIRAPASIDEAARQALVQAGYVRSGDDPAALHQAHRRARRRGALHANAGAQCRGRLFRARCAPAADGDGIHLTGSGYRVMAAIIAQTIFRDVLHLMDDPRLLDEVAAAECAATARGSGPAAVLYPRRPRGAASTASGF